MADLFYVGFCAGDNVILKTIDGGQTWSEYKIDDLGSIILQISFTDAQHGFDVCLAKLVVTEDGGTTWKITTPDKNTGYYTLSASNGSIYLSGQNKIIKSINGGKSWSALANSPADIFAIHFNDNNTGFAFGRGNYSGGDFGHFYGSIYCTSDGGRTWLGNGDIKETNGIMAVSFPTGKLGYAIGGNQVIRVSLE